MVTTADSPAIRVAHPKRLLLCPASSPEVQALASHVRHFGYQCDMVESPSELAAAGSGYPYSALILDCGARCRPSRENLDLIGGLAGSMPVLCISSDGRIETRLAAVRMGCAAYLARPLDMSIVLDTLDRLTQPAQDETGSILIIEDSPSLAAFYAATLNAAGFSTRTLTEPLNTLDELADEVPDLVLLDMHMPGISGSEVAKIIRQQDAFLSVPIVFLSSETDVDRQLEAMSQGGDEFLHKPIKPEHLVSAVRTRVKRYRALRALMLRDSLTGLLNHTSFKERLRAEVSRHRRLGKPLTVGLVDIDDFKAVNDTHGHPTGDRVIKNLARLFAQHAGPGDALGRYGGEEFAIALPDTSWEEARTRLDTIRATFSHIAHQAGDLRFRCSFSGGLAQLSASLDAAEDLIEAADQALYRAKHAGKNRVEISGAGVG